MTAGEKTGREEASGTGNGSRTRKNNLTRAERTGSFGPSTRPILIKR